MVRTFCMLAVLAAAASPAAAQETEATLFGGVATRWSRESLAVDDFEDSPEQVPARTAGSIDAGTTFGWSLSELALQLGASGGELIEWRVCARAGVATLQLSQEVAGSPRTTVATRSNDGLAGGITLDARYPFGESGWWTSAGYDLGLGYATLDNTTLLGGTPIEGTAQWLRHDAALRVGWNATPQLALFTGARAVWTTLSTEWELAFEVPGVTRDTDARFTTRHPARWLVGVAWQSSEDEMSAALEVSAGRLPSDLSVELSFRIRL